MSGTIENRMAAGSAGDASINGMPRPVSAGSRSVRANCREVVARKAGDSIKRREVPVMKQWLKALIDDLGMMSLESFPTRELARGIPVLITSMAEFVESRCENIFERPELDEVASSIANLRREEPCLAKLVADFGQLKGMVMDAAMAGLRNSDRAVGEMCKGLDEAFYRIFEAGLEAYVEKHSLELQHLADTDPLTGLFNVRYFRRQLHRQLELYKRYRIPFSLIMLDLDELKQLNDVRGHAAGDLALRNLAMILRSEKRETDIAVRYGGDEFFLLLPGTSTAEGERLAYRISRRVKEINLRSRGNEMTGVSIGVVSCPDNGTDVATLRSRADQAMYLAKTLGGGTVARSREFST